VVAVSLVHFTNTLSHDFPHIIECTFWQLR
jgi:hypothetical protein